MTAYDHRWGDQWDDRPIEEWPVGRLFGLASRFVGTYWWRMADQTGLSLAGMGVLLVLAATDGLKSSEVAERTWSTPATLTAVVNTLERDGYVERRRGRADRRVVRLHLTDKGRQRLDEVREEMTGRMGEAFDYVDPADEPAVRRFLLATVERFAPLARPDKSDPSENSDKEAQE